MSAEFVHLHNHSDYSLLDGAQTVQTLVNTIDDLKMDAVALTEHGNMFSAVNFYNNANKTGVKPIIGSEVYVAVNNRFDKKPRAEGGWGNNHLILLILGVEVPLFIIIYYFMKLPTINSAKKSANLLKFSTIAGLIAIFTDYYVR